MKMLLLLLLMALALKGAYAQEPQVDKIEISDYGIYSAKALDHMPAAETVVGNITVLGDITLTEKTRRIPAQKGVRFGFHFKILGSPDGSLAALHMVTIFPAPGITNPETHQTKAKNEFDVSKAVGTVNYRDYGFDNDWEIVPGKWTFQIWFQGRKLAEQSFDVVRQ